MDNKPMQTGEIVGLISQLAKLDPKQTNAGDVAKKFANPTLLAHEMVKSNIAINMLLTYIKRNNPEAGRQIGVAAWQAGLNVSDKIGQEVIPGAPQS